MYESKAGILIQIYINLNYIMRHVGFLWPSTNFYVVFKIFYEGKNSMMICLETLFSVKIR